MSEEKPKVPNKLLQPIIARLLQIIVPLLNHRRIPRKWTSIGKIKTYKEKDNLVIFECENGSLEIKIITETIWRVRGSKNQLSLPHKSWAAVEPQTNLKLIVKKEGQYFYVSSNNKKSSNTKLQLVINQSNSTLTFLRANGDILHSEFKSMSWSNKGSWVSCQKLSPTKERHVGFGEKTGNLVKNGRKMIFWNTDPTSYGLKDDPLYQSEPIQISIREDGTAHGIFYDNHHYSVIKGISNHGRLRIWGFLKGAL